MPLAPAPLTLAVGCVFDVDAPAPVSAVLQVAPAADPALAVRSERWDGPDAHHAYLDGYGNRCERFMVPAGRSRIAYSAEVVLAAPHDAIDPAAAETPIMYVADDHLRYVMPSRFCLPDELGTEAWERFGDLAPGWSRVQAVVDFVHGHLEFTPGGSNPWTTSSDALRAGQGVCRDFAHLAIAFCRALNIPARYVFGYIPNIGVPEPPEAMDFAAWFEVHLDGRWHTFDARNNTPRTGRVVVGRGRDAVDVALITSFGALGLEGFEVIAEPAAAGAGAAG
ncbi:transglutaminase family protein [Baekduia soli]|uniref:Transglutaminase family protein n=1 Tax=Baekduia soli TaxID=496014 RepID=A0A5B8U8K5_9ACTN|nr:transglutaminase family protein [Baekduia soli]QEC49320.1 transglutaminase family protein [Baekduia soli]